MRIQLHRIPFPLLALLLGAALSAPANAQVYKCTDVAGKTAYQSKPCPDSARSVPIEGRALPSLPALPANASMAEMRQIVAAQCVAQGPRSSPDVARIAAEQPRKFRDFCECSADNTVAQLGKVKEILDGGDKAGIERLGTQVGLACASHLQ